MLENLPFSNLHALLNLCHQSPYLISFGHKSATATFRLDQLSARKLLGVKEYLVAGGGIEPPTLGL